LTFTYWQQTVFSFGLRSWKQLQQAGVDLTVDALSTWKKVIRNAFFRKELVSMFKEQLGRFTRRYQEGRGLVESPFE